MYETVDRQTDGRTEFSSLERVCTSCSAVKTSLLEGQYRTIPSHILSRTLPLPILGQDVLKIHANIKS